MRRRMRAKLTKINNYYGWVRDVGRAGQLRNLVSYNWIEIFNKGLKQNEQLNKQ